MPSSEALQLPGETSRPTDASAAPDMSGMSLLEFLAVLRRRRMVIIQSFVLITLVAVVLTLMAHPVYRASARLIVEPPSMSFNAVDTSNPLSAILAMAPPQSVHTQVEALRSPELLADVMKKSGPAQIVVSEVEDTNVIQADAEAGTPEGAATAANTLLSLYISQDLDQSLNEITSAEQFVRTQEATSALRLQRASQHLEQFKTGNHIADLETDRTAQIQQIASLTADVQKSGADLASIRSQRTINRAQMAAEPHDTSALSRVTNPAITTINDKIADLQQARTGLTQNGGFTDTAPQIISIDAQITRLKARLASLPTLTSTQSITPNARQDALKARDEDLASQEAAVNAQINKKQAALSQAQSKIGHYSGWEITLARLMRDYNDAAAQNKMFTDKLTDLSLREKAHHSTARIDQIAAVPTVPVRPKKLYNITLGALFALFVGVCLALVQEFLDDRINSIEDSQRVLGLPSLGLVPKLSMDDARLLPQMKGLDPAAESYRLLRTNIQFASVDKPLQTLLVTSASPGEGKTTTAANLAFALAFDGKKVVLVDTDLRRPSLHKLLGLPTVPGLTDVLLGRAKLEDTLLEHVDLPNLVTLSAGSTPPNPSELLNSQRFRALTAEIAAQSDIVIFDSPPVNVASDAAILASQMDGTVLVVEAGETRKAPVRHAVALLHKGRANILGVMYNKMRALDGSGYYYYAQHYGTSTPALPSGKNGAHPLPTPEKGVEQETAAAGGKEQ